MLFNIFWNVCKKYTYLPGTYLGCGKSQIGQLFCKLLASFCTIICYIEKPFPLQTHAETIIIFIFTYSLADATKTKKIKHNLNFEKSHSIHRIYPATLWGCQYGDSKGIWPLKPGTHKPFVQAVDMARTNGPYKRVLKRHPFVRAAPYKRLVCTGHPSLRPVETAVKKIHCRAMLFCWTGHRDG